MERTQKWHRIQIYMPNPHVSILAVNKADIASYNQAKILLAKFDWQPLGLIEEKDAYSLNKTRMWIFDDSILLEDNIDLRWQSATDEIVTEVIFPSKHVAASGKPSLTLHPIGVTHLDKGSEPPFGGKSGFAPPPSTRLAAWWKEFQKRAFDTDIAERFELTLEVTHHGPWLNVPSLFIEIGSTKNDWPDMDAANFLAGIIASGMGLDGGSQIGVWDEKKNSGDLVLITLGGGHYAPRANKIASMDGVWLGHMLATYSLPFEKPLVEGELPRGTWCQSISAAINSTRAAFPGGDIVCSMDKKAFKGWQRQAIRDHLSKNQIPLLTTKKIVEFLTTKSQPS